MPESLNSLFAWDANLSWEILVVRLLAALLLGTLVAGIYRVTQGRGSPGMQSLMATLVMLSVLIAMVTLIIGENQARAFSLVGALAIIRFRTVVEDTRDTAFVIFAVAVGMGAGAGYIGLTLLGLPIAASAAFLFRPNALLADRGNPEHLVTLRCSLGRQPDEIVASVFPKFGLERRLVSAGTARQGSAVEVTWAVRLASLDSVLPLVSELNSLEGVQSVEIRPAAPSGAD